MSSDQQFQADTNVIADRIRFENECAHNARSAAAMAGIIIAILKYIAWITSLGSIFTSRHFDKKAPLWRSQWESSFAKMSLNPGSKWLARDTTLLTYLYSFWSFAVIIMPLMALLFCFSGIYAIAIVFPLMGVFMGLRFAKNELRRRREYVAALKAVVWEKPWLVAPGDEYSAKNLGLNDTNDYLTLFAVKRKFLGPLQLAELRKTHAHLFEEPTCQPRLKLEAETFLLTTYHGVEIDPREYGSLSNQIHFETLIASRNHEIKMGITNRKFQDILASHASLSGGNRANN